MGFTTSNLSLYHTFSKTPVDSNVNSAAAQLGNAINKSGHTVQSNEIWTESIPFYGLAATTTAIHTKFSATAKVNDLVKDSDGKIWQRNSTAYSPSATFNNLWSEKTKSITSFTKGTDGKYTFTEADGALVDGSYLLNSEGVPTVKYYEKRLLTRLTADNNANTNSDNKASRLQIDGKWIDQFIGVTDIYLNGSAAVSYAPVLRKTASSSPMQSGPGKAYMDYCATGLILWESSATGTEVIDCFEYIGDKLDTALGNIDGKIQDIVDTTMEGVVSSVGTTDAATNAGISVDSSSKTSPKINITTGTIGGDADAKLVTGSTVKSYVSLLEEKVNDHLVDAAGKLEISVLDIAYKLPKQPFFENENAYIKACGFEWEKLPTNIYTKKFEVKVAQSVDGLAEFSSHTDGTVLTPSSLGNGTCKLVVYSVVGTSDATAQLTEVAVSQPNTFDTSTSIYAFKFDNQISLSAGGRYRFCFRTVDGTNALHCLPVIINSSNKNSDVAKSSILNRYIIGEAAGDWWGCWAGNISGLTINGVEQAAYGPKASFTGLTLTPNEDGDTAAITGEKGKIYLSPNAGTENQNVYDEYIWTNNTWEKIGTTKVDLTDYVKSVTVNGTTYAANTTNAGALDLGTVVRAASQENHGGWDPSDYNLNIDKGAIYTNIASDGTLTQGINVASNTHYGVSKMFTGDLAPNNNSTVTDTALSVKTASAMYYILSNSINNSVRTINGAIVRDGAIDFCAHNYVGSEHVGEGITIGNAPNHANLWGMTFVSSHAGLVSLVDEFVGMSASYLTTANLPSDAVSVENNFVYNSEGRVITTIRPERMVSGFNADACTENLKSFVGDLSNLTTARLDKSIATFYNCIALTTFIGDLSSLTNGNRMFESSSRLSTFISDLSSLTSGYDMFYDNSLSLESVENIADTINDLSDDTRDESVYNWGNITISWGNRIEDEDKKQALVDVLSRIVDKGWALKTNDELLPLFDSEKYQVVQPIVQPLDLDSEPQEIAYVIKK